MWGRELPRRRPWDQSRLMVPAHPLLRGETLAVHLRVSGNRGLFGFIMMMPKRETQSEELLHTNSERDSQVPTYRRVWCAVTVDGFVSDCVMYDSQHASATGPIPGISYLLSISQWEETININLRAVVYPKDWKKEEYKTGCLRGNKWCAGASKSNYNHNCCRYINVHEKVKQTKSIF